MTSTLYQETISSQREEITGQWSKPFIGNGSNGSNGTYNIQTTENRLRLSFKDFPKLSQIFSKYGSINVQFVSIGRNNPGENNMKSLLSYFNFRNFLQITLDLQENEDNNSKFADTLIRTLIEVLSNLSLIRLKLDSSSENEYNGLYFTTNVGFSQKIIEFLKSKCSVSDQIAKLSVWRILFAKNLLLRDSITKEFINLEIYDNGNQRKSFKKIFEHIESESARYSENSSQYSNNYTSSTTTTTTTTMSSSKKSSWVVEEEEHFDALLSRKKCSKSDETYEIVYIHKITVQVNSTQRENIIISLKLNVLSSDAPNICSIQDNNGSFSKIHKIILEHLNIESIDEAIEGLTFFVGLKDFGLKGFELEDSENCNHLILKYLRDCDILIWQTAFVMIYLKKVLDEYESKWKSAYDSAEEWICEQLGDSRYMNQCMELLFFASGEYLIKKGIEVHNALRNKTTYSFKVNYNTIETIKEIFRNSTTNDKDINELINSQRNDGHFERHELVYGSFKIPLFDRHIETLKKFADRLCLRRLDKDVWITSLVIIFFKEILDEYKSESELESAYESAKDWISQKVYNSEYEEELYEACTKYLHKKVFDHLF